MAPRQVAAAAVLLVAVSGCSLFQPGPAPLADGITVLARVEDWRAELTSDPDGSRVVPEVLVEVAYDEATARRAWAANVPDGLPQRSGQPGANGVHGDLADVDFAEQALVVYSSGQSGSCPAWLVDVSFADGVLGVAETHQIPAGDNGCNDSRVPYRLVLAVDRDKLPHADVLPVERVRIDERDASDALVATYPAPV